MTDAREEGKNVRRDGAKWDPVAPVETYAEVEIGFYSLGCWDAPWPLEPGTDRAREPRVGWLTRGRVILFLMVVLGILLLAAAWAGAPLTSFREIPRIVG